MKVKIEEISIKKRVRQNLGDLNQLMVSMKHHGQMNPILLTKRLELIAGHRRLESAKRLGWTDIEAKIIDNTTETNKLEIELDENVQRRNLSPDELADGYSRLQKLRNPGFFTRLWRWIKAFFRKLFGRKEEKE